MQGMIMKTEHGPGTTSRAHEQGNEMEQQMCVKTTGDKEPPGATAKGKVRARRDEQQRGSRESNDTSTRKQAGSQDGSTQLYRLSHRGTACC